MTYDNWKTKDDTPGEEPRDDEQEERELLYASIKRLRTSHDLLLAAAKEAINPESTRWMTVSCYNNLQAAIIAAEEYALQTKGTR
jgi:hypothetical protein